MSKVKYTGGRIQDMRWFEILNDPTFYGLPTIHKIRSVGPNEVADPKNRPSGIEIDVIWSTNHHGWFGVYTYMILDDKILTKTWHGDPWCVMIIRDGLCSDPEVWYAVEPDKAEMVRELIANAWD